MASTKSMRSCQPCTACCDGWLRMQIGDVEVFPGSPCPHSTGSRCDDHARRPDSCVKFSCGWLLPNSPLPDWFKPNKANVIAIFNKLEWSGLPVDLAVPVGKRISPRVLNWLKRFAEQHRRPLLYAEQIVENGKFQKQQVIYAHGPAGFREQVRIWQEQGRPLW